MVNKNHYNHTWQDWLSGCVPKYQPQKQETNNWNDISMVKHNNNNKHSTTDNSAMLHGKHSVLQDCFVEAVIAVVMIHWTKLTPIRSIPLACYE